jgi:bifunctional UDP-N-acetylglucosamine pyrophosphorylase/glucosamine-1-phosphate N-acetyltransferase
MATSAAPTVAVVLAAGMGTRMSSALPKVLHPVAGRPLLEWVLEAARSAAARRTLVVVGHGAEEVQEAVAGGDVSWVIQAEQRGTGHALAQVEPYLDEAGTLLVLSGDAPLVTPGTLAGLVDLASAGWGALAVAELAKPGSLGRVLANDEGDLDRIVEAADATPEELAVKRVNAGIYALPAPEVFDFLSRLEPANAKGELYLTDALSAAVGAGRRVALYRLPDPLEALGVNDRQDLSRAHRALLVRKAAELMTAGVTVLDPARTVIEHRVEVGADTILHPDVALLGETRIGGGCALHQGAWVRDSQLGHGVTVAPYSVLDGARIADGCRIGPYARLRPGAVLEEGARVGNFVEVKNATLGPGVKANHLAYLGDASIGEGSNVGAGVVTCNYDGVAKRPTEIGRDAFVGSDTMLVAPVRVGDGAMTGAGSVITRDVPDGALAVERARQRNLPGWVARRRKKKD